MQKKEKIDMFLITMGDNFPQFKMMMIQSQLEKVDENRIPFIQSLPYKKPLVMLIISLAVGVLGIDRFMLGQPGLGVVKLLTCGGLGIWALIDLFCIMKATKEQNYQLFMKYAL